MADGTRPTSPIRCPHPRQMRCCFGGHLTPPRASDPSEADDAILDDQALTRGVLNPGIARASPVDEHSVQVNGVACPGADRDAGAAGGDGNSGKSVPLNADRLKD